MHCLLALRSGPGLVPATRLRGEMMCAARAAALIRHRSKEGGHSLTHSYKLVVPLSDWVPGWLGGADTLPGNTRHACGGEVNFCARLLQFGRLRRQGHVLLQRHLNWPN